MMKKALNKIANIIPYLILLVAFILIISVASSIRKGETPTIFGRAMFLVVTPSMEDTIMVGDIIIVNTNETEYHVGDIITFYADINNDGTDEAITHRIISINTDTDTTLYTTMGDNNTLSNDWEIDFTDDIIIGKYVTKSGFLGSVYATLFGGGVNLIFLVIILVFITIGVMEVISIVKTVSMAKEKEAVKEEKERLIQIELEKLRNEQKKKEE